MPVTILVVDDAVDTRDLIHLYLTGPAHNGQGSNQLAGLHPCA